MKRVFVLLLSLSITIFSSCEKETLLSVDLTSVSFTDAVESQTISLTANKPWTVNSSQSWCKVSPSGGEEAANSRVTITCDANTSYDERSCTVTFTCAELTKTVSVTQATNKGLLVAQTSYELTNEAQLLNIEVKANVKFDIDIDNACKDWVKYDKTKGLSSSTVVLEIAQNKNYDDREGKIVIKEGNGRLTETIQIKQLCANGFEIEKTEYSCNYLAQTLSIDVLSNINYVATSKAQWISIPKTVTKSLSSTPCEIVISENNLRTQRRGTIVFTYQSIKKEVDIVQGPHYYTYYTPLYEISYTSQTIHATLSSNTKLTVSAPKEDDWVTTTLRIKYAYPEDDYYEYDLEIHVGENTNLKRSTNIAIASEDGVDQGQITIKQVGMKDNVSVLLSGNNSLESTLSKYDISSITNLKIKGHMSEIDVLFLNKLSNLYALDISETDIKVIAKNYFVNFKKLSNIYLPSQLTTIEEGAFRGCSSLAEISIPQSVELLFSYAFDGCSKLQKVAFSEPSSLRVVSEYAFSRCTSLRSVSLPSSLKKIEYGAFYHCQSLETIDLPEGLETIESCPYIVRNQSELCREFSGDTTQGAFAECINLQSVAFPSSLKKIGAGAFYRCVELKEISFGNQSSLEIIDGCYYHIYRSDPTRNRITVFGAFANCTSLTSVKLPESLKTIGPGAFYGCSALSNVAFGDHSELSKILSRSIYERGYGNGNTLHGSVGPFANTAIKEIIIPSGVKEIWEGTFYNCPQLKKVSFAKGSKLQHIHGIPMVNGDYIKEFFAFYGTNIKEFDASNCTMLYDCYGINGAGIEILKIGSVNPPKAGWINLSNYSILYVPSESIEKYNQDSFWQTFSTIKPL